MGHLVYSLVDGLNVRGIFTSDTGVAAVTADWVAAVVPVVIRAHGVAAVVPGVIRAHGFTDVLEDVKVPGDMAVVPGATVAVSCSIWIVLEGITDFSQFTRCFKNVALLMHVLGQYGQWKCLILQHSK